MPIPLPMRQVLSIAYASPSLMKRILEQKENNCKKKLSNATVPGGRRMDTSVMDKGSGDATV